MREGWGKFLFLFFLDRVSQVSQMSHSETNKTNETVCVDRFCLLIAHPVGLLERIRQLLVYAL